MFVPLLIKYAGLVEVIDAYFAGGVENALIVEHHAHVDNMAFLVTEESQVAWLDFGKEIHQLALLNLL